MASTEGSMKRKSEPSSTEVGEGSPKRQRSKSLSRPSPSFLERVNESEELVTSSSPVRHESCPGGFFGVKSYLHNFYEQVSVKDPKLLEEYEEYRYLIAPKEKRRTLFFWRIVFWIGFFFLLVGASILTLGYVMPRKNIDVGYQEEMRIIDRAAYMFNQNLDLCKVFGLAVFCVGGTLLSAALLLPTLVGVSCLEEDPDELTPFKLRIVDDDDDDDDFEKTVKIPATEQVKSVQPKREDEMIITKKGLTKVK